MKFFLNKKDGLYNNISQKELEKMSEDILKEVIKTVDQSMEVFKEIKEEKYFPSP